MPNKRHPHSPPVPSLDPDPKEPLVADTPAEAAASAPAGPSEAEGWKDRHLRLAAEYDNFRTRTAKERTDTWQRADAELISRLADALDDLSRVPHLDRGATDHKT